MQHEFLICESNQRHGKILWDLLVFFSHPKRWILFIALFTAHIPVPKLYQNQEGLS